MLVAFGGAMAYALWPDDVTWWMALLAAGPLMGLYGWYQERSEESTAPGTGGDNTVWDLKDPGAGGGGF